MGKKYGKEVKEEVLGKVRSGRKAAEVADEHGINRQTVYAWISSSAEDPKVDLHEMSRLKRQNEALLKLLGRVMYEQEVGKKNGFNF